MLKRANINFADTLMAHTTIAARPVVNKYSRVVRSDGYHSVSSCHLTQALSISQAMLADLLQAYERVLNAKGIPAQEDTHYYGLLLRLAVDSLPDWQTRIQRERQAVDR